MLLYAFQETVLLDVHFRNTGTRFWDLGRKVPQDAMKIAWCDTVLMIWPENEEIAAMSEGPVSRK